MDAMEMKQLAQYIREAEQETESRSLGTFRSLWVPVGFLPAPHRGDCHRIQQGIDPNRPIFFKVIFYSISIFS